MGLDTLYCITDSPDTVIGVSPTTKLFGGPGITQISLNPAIAVFNPSAAGPGLHVINYFTGSWQVRVVDLTPATLNPFPAVCENGPSFPLSGGSPAGGYYTVNGIEHIIQFDPSSYSPGNHFVTYAIGACGIVSPPQAIIVKAIPVITFNPLPVVCINTAPFVLDDALPTGGTYSGPGVSGNIFNPSTAGVGVHTIKYSYSNGTCSNEAYQTIEVEDLPVVSFTGLDTLFCDTDPQVLLTGSPVLPPGIFTGNGITDNGNGTALFNPASSGLGYHQIKYSYASINGCSSSYTKQVRVGTLLTFSGLAAKYCADNPDIVFTYNPPGGTFNPATGLTDHMDGTAGFSPSTGIQGTRTIHYIYTDIYGCINNLVKDVQISPVPVVNFTGLDPAGYCKNGTSITLSGNHAPLGTFSGPGISDNGNGTAVFNPQVLPVGGPYLINYSYTDLSSGCDNSISKSTNIHPIPQATISGDETLCIGGSASLNVDFSGTGPFDFTYSNGLSSSTVTGAPDPYTLMVSPSETSVFTIESVTQANGCSNTGAGQGNVTVNQFSVILSNPTGKTVCPGENINFSVSASGAGLAYQWKKDGNPIPGKTAAVLNINIVQAVDAGSYTCVVSSSCGPDITSAPAILSVLPQTLINLQPTDQIKCEGQNTILNIQAAGSNLVYQWKKNGTNLTDGAGITGSNTDNLNLTGLNISDAGIYTCTITGVCGSLTSNPANLTVNENLSISAQPQSKAVCPGTNTSFSVIAAGTALSYQWQKNGVNVPGANSPSLTINNVNSSNSGDYKCLISGSCGTLSSNTVSLTVYEAVSILTQPVNLSSCEGNAVEINLIASGSNLAYQWKHNGIDLLNGGNVNGAKSPNLTLTNLSTANTGAYTCIVSGSCGSVSSSTAMLIVDEAIVINTNPNSQSACPGANVILTSAASGTHLSYQWVKDAIAMPGKNSPGLALSSVSSADEGNYLTIISNACGNVSSNTAALSVNSLPAMSSQPAALILCEGDNGSFTVSATGSGLSYQWLKNGIALSEGGGFSGTQSNELLLSNVSAGDAGVFICMVNSNCGSLSSDPANLTVNENISILSQPANKTVCPGTNVVFAVIASGTNLDYQWQFEGVDLPGETANDLFLSNVDDLDEGMYRCIITGDCGNIASNSASLTVNNSIILLSNPVNKQICEGSNVNFSVSVSGTGINYQWRKNGTALVDGGRITGSKTSNLIINTITDTDQGVYSCNITGTCGSINSLPADLIVYPQTNIVVQPVVFEAVENGNASFSITAEGHNLSYQWYKNGTALLNDATYSGVNSSVLNISNLNSSHAGSYYCMVTGFCGSVTSNPGLLNVNLLTIISVHPAGPVDKCVDESVSFDVVASGTNAVYQWMKNGVNLSDNVRISGSNSPNLNISPLLSSDAGSYSCFVSGDEGVENSLPAVLTVNKLTDITLHPLDANKCEGDDVTFVINTSGTITSYQWKKEGINLTDDGRINGSLSAVLTISNLTTADNGIYTCSVTGICADDASNPATLTVYQNTLITQEPVSKSRCTGTSATFRVEAEGGNLFYQWKKNGTNISNGGNISGANSAEISIINIWYC